MTNIVSENKNCPISLCGGSNFKLKAYFHVQNIPFFDLTTKTSGKIHNFLKYCHFWISVNDTFAKSEIIYQKLILTQWKCLKMVRKGLFFKFLGFSRKLRPPAEQKSAFLIFKDNSGHNTWEKREIPSNFQNHKRFGSAVT